MTDQNIALAHDPYDLSAYGEIAHASADKVVTTNLCYFAAAPAGPIKIGYSSNVKARIKQLRWEHGKDIALLATAPGGRDRESAYHMQFNTIRLDGEWFTRHPDILAEIARLSSLPPPAREGGSV